MQLITWGAAVLDFDASAYAVAGCLSIHLENLCSLAGFTVYRDFAVSVNSSTIQHHEKNKWR